MNNEKINTAPWDKEPNHEEFEHNGYTCLLNRGPLGTWCGYVFLNDIKKRELNKLVKKN